MKENMGADYVTRMDSMGQATDVHAPLETGVDGGAPGAMDVPSGRAKIEEILVAVVVDGAHTLDSGNVFTLEIGKQAKGAPHELIVAAMAEQEIGTVATAVLVYVPPFKLEVDFEVVQGKQNYRAAYGGTDPGTPELYLTAVFG